MCASHPRSRAPLAREHRSAFNAAPRDSGPDAEPVGAPSHQSRVEPHLRDAVSSLDLAVDEVHRALNTSVDPDGRTAALVDLLRSIDRAQAAAVRLVGDLDSGDLSMRRNGLPLRDVLAFSTRLTRHERRSMSRVAAGLRRMPHLADAFSRGSVGFGEVRAVTAEVRDIGEDDRAAIDQRFADDADLQGIGADRLLDEVRRDADDARAAKRVEERSSRRIERRFLSVQPQLDGALTLYAELDPEAGATVLEAFDAAAPAPAEGRYDHTRHALDEDESFADPATDPVAAATAHRTHGRRRADALLRLAEGFLAGTPGRRARPRMQVVTDIATLTGDGRAARAAKLLWQTHGIAPSLTPAAARRLASDADLQFVLTDGAEILGVCRPTAAIPAKVRAAVRTRDQGCRFPGCDTPIQWCDLHHVVPREKGGATTVDNLVATCRRHHTAVTEGRWRLTMTSDADVTVTRGRRRATSRPHLPRRPNGP